MPQYPPIKQVASLADARRVYDGDMAEIARLMRAAPQYAKDQTTREQAEFYIEQVKAVAYNLLISPQQQYPKFLVDTLFGPNLFPIYAPNPDFKYSWAWVDGCKSYRIWGNIHDTTWGGFQVTTEFWGSPEQKQVGDFTYDRMNIAPDGSYEITVSAKKPAHGNWIKLDPDSENNYIFLRRAMVDWEKEKVATAFIEMLDDTDTPIHMDEAKLALRIARAGRCILNSTVLYTLEHADRTIKNVGVNTFYTIDGSKLQDDGYNPGAYYINGVFDLGPDEAVLVEAKVVNPLYWGMHVTDTWLQSLDFAHHQTSLNASQAATDSDGVLRFVVSRTDPGIANWLDTVGTSFGMLQFRSYHGDAPPKLSMRVLPLSEIRNALPAGTPQVKPSERRAILQKRARALLQHYST